MLKLDLVRSPMEEIAEALEKGTITSAELVTHYLGGFLSGETKD
jgi:hypothetical protein